MNIDMDTLSTCLKNSGRDMDRSTDIDMVMNMNPDTGIAVDTDMCCKAIV
jgi:hypothetical protein